jgi:hypothetical protein
LPSDGAGACANRTIIRQPGRGDLTEGERRFRFRCSSGTRQG